MDLSAARFGWDILQTIITAIIAIYVWWTARTAATKQSIDGVDERVDQVVSRLDRVEHTLEHRPDYGDLEALRQDLAKTNQNLAQVGAQLQNANHLLNRLHDYLLQERREK